MRPRIIIGLLVTLVFGVGSGTAQTTWTGAYSPNWSDNTSPFNWSGGVPISTSTVNFTTAGASNIDAAFTIATLNISGGSDTFNSTNSGTLTVTGATNVTTSGAVFNLGLLGTGTLNLTGGGTLILNSGGASTYSGATTVYGSGSILSDGATNAFSPNSVIDIGPYGTVRVYNNETIAGLNDYGGGGGSVVFQNSNITLLVNGGATTTFSGVISGPGGLEKDGASSLILTAANTYTGATVVGAGASIQLGNGTTAGSLASPGVSGSGSLVFDSPTTASYSGVLSGALGVANWGGTTTLSGANTYSGATTVLAGTLTAGSTSAFGGATGLSPVTVSNSGVLDLNGFNNTVGSLNGSSTTASVYLSGGANLTIATGNNALPFLGVISGNGSLTISPPSYQWIGGANTYTGGTTITSGTLLADNASGSATGTGSISIAHLAVLQIGNNSDSAGIINATAAITDNGSVDFSRGDATTFANNITGSGGVGQFKGGTTTLSGTNTYSGTTEIFYGTLKAGSTSAFGGASGLSLMSFTYLGTLDLNGFDNTVGFLDGGTTAGNLVKLGGNTLTIAGTSGTHTFSGVIQGTGGNLSVTGTGATQILDGANTFSGTTSIASGATLSVGDGTALGASLASSVVNSGTLTFAPGLTDASSYLGIISGGGGVTIAGANNGTNIGSILLGTANTYTGGTQVISGELFVGNSTTGSPGSVVSGPVGTGTLTFVSSEFDTEFSPTANVTIANDIVFNGTVDNDDGGANSLTLTGALSGTGTFAWCTTGNLNILGSNPSFTGTMDMRSGSLYLGSDTALGSASVTLDSGSSIDAYGSSVTRAIPYAIYLNGSTAQIGNGNNNNLTFSGVISGGGPAVVTVDNGPSGSVTFSGLNTIAGTGTTFNVNNAGTVYAANNSAFGASTNNLTLQNGSTLNVLGGITIQNPITIGSGANTLAGSGTIQNGGVSLPITNSVIISPSASPGGGPGNLTFTTPLVFVGGAIHFQLYDATGSAGSGWGLISTGGMDFSGATANSITFNVVSGDGSGNPANTIHFNSGNSYSWTFATSPTTITGFNAADFNIVTSGFTNSMGGGSFYVSEVGNNLNLNFTPVPEPSTWALIGPGVLAVVPLALRRRRARAS